jgi:hypothetical protein
MFNYKTYNFKKTDISQFIKSKKEYIQEIA